MEVEIVVKALLSLGLVFAAMYLLLKIIQRYSNIGSKRGSKGNNLKIENIVYIDETTKVVDISSASGSNYVIAIAKDNSFLVEKYQAKKVEDEK